MRTRRGAPSSKSTKRLATAARATPRVELRRVAQTGLDSRTSTRRSSRSTALSRAGSWATTRPSRGARRTPITPTWRGAERRGRRRRVVRVGRAGDVARGGVGSDRAVVPRPRRRREQLRRAEEPVGLDGLHDTRVEAQPGDGGRDCVDLRRVGAVHAVGGGRQGRSDHNAALAAVRPCAARAARAADDADNHEFARQSGPAATGVGSGERLSQARSGHCGAVGLHRAGGD